MSARPLQKTPTGINGLDEITSGGLPKGRPTLIAGAAGCGKTLMAMEFLVRGATQFDEPGVFIAFEENEDELTTNVASLGFDLSALIARKKMMLDHVRIERSEIHETGEYDLEGLFVRLGYAIDAVKARRVVLDTIEALFAGLPNEAILRAELRRLFRWLKEKGVTAVITAERGERALTRHGLEEYVADCVIVLDHRVHNQVSTRRLRVVKYRGSRHGTNEYPFLIGEQGISVLPITSIALSHQAPTRRVSSGVPRLDAMLGGKGFYQGSSILVSGTSGTGKTTLAATFAAAACQRGERVLFLPFEESPDQVMRNMKSVGIELAPCVRKGLLHFHAVRPNLHGLEMHLLNIQAYVREIRPDIVILDPVTNLISVGDLMEVRAMLTRLIDYLKWQQITAMFTSLTGGGEAVEQSEIGVSSLMDTWLLVRNLECAGERNRAIYVLKSRGMAHSNQVREFVLSSKGIQLVDVYTGGGTVLTGAARVAQEAVESAQSKARQQELSRLQREMNRKRRSAQAQIAVLQTQLEAEQEELEQTIRQESLREAASASTRTRLARARMADNGPETRARPSETRRRRKTKVKAQRTL